MSDRIVILGACRTAIGKMGGSLSQIPAAKLGAIVIEEAIKRAGVLPEQVDEVYMGCVLQSAQGQNVARQSTLLAGLPKEVPATTVNVVCGSGLKAVQMAANLIQSQDAEIVIAGGTENMSLSPYALPEARFGYRMNNGSIIDTMVNDALTDAFHHYHMGITAENVAEQFQVEREEMDYFAESSQKKALKAIAENRFQNEIVPVTIKNKKETYEFKVDEGPREGTSFESLQKLRPAFKEGGRVTAGNSSTINDGAAAMVLMSEKKAKSLGLKPMAYFCAGALGGVDPSIMGIGPVVSTNKILKKLGISMKDINLIEANEAFAAQCLAVGKELEFDISKLNVNGGAIALGHPVGCSGARILVTLLHEMEKREEARLGLATLCIGGGMGCSAIVEKYL